MAGIRIAQMWNVPRLFNYSLDHFKRKFKDGTIHPAVVLGVARQNGIPSLIQPAVEALASPAMSLSSWCSQEELLCYVGVFEVSAIARMKEQLYIARLSLLDVPQALHGKDCPNATNCRVAWESYWLMQVGKKIRRLLDDGISHELWFIRSEILRAQVDGMRQSCVAMTVDAVGGNKCWEAHKQIVDGATRYLMVVERVPDWMGPHNSS